VEFSCMVANNNSDVGIGKWLNLRW